MSDDRTKEQREAEEALDQAVRRVYASYDGEMLLTDWMVVFAHVGVHEDDQVSEIELIMPPGSMPLHHAEGLLQRGLKRLDEQQRRDE